MEEAKIDHAAMGRLAKALDFICGPDHLTTVTLKEAAESGSEKDIKKARTLFLGLKPGAGAATLSGREHAMNNGRLGSEPHNAVASPTAKTTAEPEKPSSKVNGLDDGDATRQRSLLAKGFLICS